MFYEEWKPIYKKIEEDFNFNIEDENKTSSILNKLLTNNLPIINKIENIIEKKEVFIFGAGPTLKKSIQKYKKKFVDKILIASDGTTTALLKSKIYPDIIVTDLDGDIYEQIKANSKGSIIIIHAHGDNINKINKYVTKFKGEIIGTTQINPKSYKNLHNFGGFTDGDRAVNLAVHFHANKIYLIGFDFNNEIGQYAYMRNKDKKQKLKKLKWCKYIIETLSKKTEIQYI